MQTRTRRVGKHVKHVESWFIFEVFGFVGVIVGPDCLPFGLDTGKVVFLGRISLFEKTADLEACLCVRQCLKVDLPESASFLIYTSEQITS